MSKFSIGDKVRIVPRHTENLNAYYSEFVMEHFGEETKIKDVIPFSECSMVYYYVESNKYWWYESELELIDTSCFDEHELIDLFL